VAQTSATYDLHRCTLCRKNFSDTPKLWQSCNRVRGVLPACQDIHRDRKNGPPKQNAV